MAAGGVYRKAAGVTQAAYSGRGRSSRVCWAHFVAADAAKGRLPEHPIGGHWASYPRGQRADVLKDPVVPVVGDVEVAGGVDRHACREAQATGTGHAVTAGVDIAAEVSLPEYPIGRCVPTGGRTECRWHTRTMEGIVVLQHPVIATVGHVEVVVGVYRHAVGIAQAGGVKRGVAPGIVAGACRKAAQLPEHPIGSCVTTAQRSRRTTVIEI
jgi:hypothetical protein